ncbi:WecB/TagA/CpsF family glycosyltransferase [Enterococcus mediterraneensis]|uniref:WecB/TagA/CpsF family glycosyltransferase n=1 Tax=Enterococcus mediterraneensis TaxID=2364791 RepID=UPI0019D1C5B2|nr:WecB/TagA/CpsF family glycosyltransferase [Enterococcus mediterraneensis]
MKHEWIMGIPVDQLTYEDILEDVPRYLDSSKKMSAISVNPQIATQSKDFPEVVEFIKSSTHRIPDGIGIVLVSKLTGGKIKERVAGFELMQKFLEYANENSRSAFFYGAKPEVLQDAMANLQQQYPAMKIAGAIDGYTALSEDEVVDQINQASPDFLFVALGFPRQEQWLARNIKRVDATIFQDVGGSFDVLSGHVKRAPQFYLDHHLEWLYRSLSNPARIGRIFQLPVFVIKSLWWKMRNK